MNYEQTDFRVLPDFDFFQKLSAFARDYNDEQLLISALIDANPNALARSENGNSISFKTPTAPTITDPPFCNLLHFHLCRSKAILKYSSVHVKYMKLTRYMQFKKKDY